MVYYNNISSAKMVMFIIVSYVCFTIVAVWIFLSDFSLRNYERAQIVDVRTNNEYIIKGVCKDDPDSFEMVIVTDVSIHAVGQDYYEMEQINDSLYGIKLKGQDDIHSSQSDHIYMFPKH